MHLHRRPPHCLDSCLQSCSRDLKGDFGGERVVTTGGSPRSRLWYLLQGDEGLDRRDKLEPRYLSEPGGLCTRAAIEGLV